MIKTFISTSVLALAILAPALVFSSASWANIPNLAEPSSQNLQQSLQNEQLNTLNMQNQLNTVQAEARASRVPGMVGSVQQNQQLLNTIQSQARQNPLSASGLSMAQMPIQQQQMALNNPALTRRW